MSEKKRKAYTAPKIEVFSQPVLNVHAAVSQMSTSQSLAVKFTDTNLFQASSTYWFVSVHEK